jgi:CRP-like cAMP-binding protein/Fe-S-cluster-containing hydrogenase component 2
MPSTDANTPEQSPKIVVPMPPGVEVMEIDRLREVPIFSKLADNVLRRLQPNVQERLFEPGEQILRMGDYGDAAYYLAEGAAEVRLTGMAPSTPTATTVAGTRPERFLARLTRLLQRHRESPAPTPRSGVADDGTILLADMPVDGNPAERVLLEAGEIFGEMSALSRYPISADVIAATPVRCIIIRTPALRLMMKQRELAGFKTFIDERYRTRALANHLQRVDLFRELDASAIATLRDRAELLAFEPGKVIVEQGAPADAFYLVRGGFVKVGLRAGSGELAVSYLRKGDYAGEIALLLDEPWPYTLTALEHVELVKLTRADFEEALSPHPEVQRVLWSVAVQRLKERGYAARNPLSSRYLQMAMDTGLIHGESVLLIDLHKCTRCDDCVRGCADTHGGTPRFLREGLKFGHFSVVTACYHCTDPVCMIGCPTGAITRPLGTREVTINPQTCIGCHNCVRRCPWGNIIPVPYHSPTLQRDIELATKCDLCVGRDAGPACVQMCPHGATVRVNFKDLDVMTKTIGG